MSASVYVGKVLVVHVGNVPDVPPTLPADSVDAVVGVELSPEYAEMAERRIAPHRDQMQLEVTT